jgi:hypothetical protein
VFRTAFKEKKTSVWATLFGEVGEDMLAGPSWRFEAPLLGSHIFLNSFGMSIRRALAVAGSIKGAWNLQIGASSTWNSGLVAPFAHFAPVLACYVKYLLPFGTFPCRKSWL